MKTLLLLVSLSAISYASDNCYIFEPNTPEWNDCKVQAADYQHKQEKSEQESNQLMQELNQAQANQILLQQLQQMIDTQTKGK